MEKKYSDELDIATKDLVFQQRAELISATKQLAFQNEEKEKLAEELAVAYKELKKAENCLKEHARGLEEMMFMTSHKVRQPIARILGIAYLLDKFVSLPKKLKVLLEYIKKSAMTLDIYTKELTVFMTVLEQKGKK